MKILGQVTNQSIQLNTETGYLVNVFFINGYSSSVFAFSNKYGIYWYN